MKQSLDLLLRSDTAEPTLDRQLTHQLKRTVDTPDDISGQQTDTQGSGNAPTKKSRKSQGVGIKKPLYSKYETLFIIKAFQKIVQKHPTLVLVDIFKIIEILFNQESIIKGFQKRTGDQLYQKYKRIQYGLNHGETGSEQLEFAKYFKRSQFSLKEWIPIDFDAVNSPTDDDCVMLKSICLKGLEDAIDEVLNNRNKANGQYHTELKQERDNTTDVCPQLNLSSVPDGEHHKTLVLLEQQVQIQQSHINTLNKSIAEKNHEIEFLKQMIKEDLSYIRHKINDSNK